MAAHYAKRQRSSVSQNDNVALEPERKHALTEADQVRFRQLLLEASNAFFAAVESQQPGHASVCRNQMDLTASALKKALRIVEEFSTV